MCQTDRQSDTYATQVLVMFLQGIQAAEKDAPLTKASTDCSYLRSAESVNSTVRQCLARHRGSRKRRASY